MRRNLYQGWERTTTEGYAVYINDKKEIKYLAKQRSDLVVSLSDYLQTRVVSLPEKTRIFESPSFGAKFIAAPSEVPFGIDSVSADWVKIHTTTMCGYELRTRLQVGLNSERVTRLYWTFILVVDEDINYLMSWEE